MANAPYRRVLSKPILVLVACASALLAYSLLARSSEPDHEAGHERFHDQFYKRLRIPGTVVPCCNDNDCRPTEFRVTSAGVVFFVRGRWIKPPPERVIQRTTPDGGGHWCGVAFKGGLAHTYCAIIPPTPS